MSYKAMWRNKHARACSSTRPSTVVAHTTGSGIPRGMVQYGTFRVLRGPDGKDRFLMPPEYGNFMTLKEADELDRTTGRAVPYGRNTVRFVMSRAARKRGYTTDDWMYNSRAAKGQSLVTPYHSAT